ncbi:MULTISPECIES: DsbA family protein [Lacticaseibacillus]|uniref:DsbA family protein n=1 Tax=Lacticaseibacillus yichunensis TaxID=2486015 RepID=A0ABW4CN05_9LACO|nr:MULTISPECIES: DsbA family protein [Lacticaseibacillus]
MLEIFLFVNPLGTRCRHAEQAMTRIAQELPTPITLHFVPLVNFAIIDAFMARHHLDENDLALRNQLFDAAYQVSLDYKAAQFQGNRLARALLIAEQEMFRHHHRQYDAAFADQCIQASGLDREAFDADRAEEAAMHNCFTSDQRIAYEMGVTETPAAVIFDVTHPDRDGVRVLNITSYHHLKHICEQIGAASQPLPPQRLLHIL